MNGPNYDRQMPSDVLSLGLPVPCARKAPAAVQAQATRGLYLEGADNAALSAVFDVVPTHLAPRVRARPESDRLQAPRSDEAVDPA